MYTPFYIDILTCYVHTIKQTKKKKEEKNRIIDIIHVIYMYLVIHYLAYFLCFDSNQGPVVQSMVRLTSSLRGQLVKCFTTL